jgi:hypothetical protein
LPSFELEATVHGDQPALREVLGGGLAAVPEHADVDVANLLVAAHPVDRDPELADARSVRQVAKLGVLRQTAGAEVLVDVHSWSFRWLVVLVTQTSTADDRRAEPKPDTAKGHPLAG